MKGLIALYFGICVIILWDQIGHYAYYALYKPKESILERYSEPQHPEITEKTSLEELSRLYDEARTKVKEYDKSGKKLAEDDPERFTKEPYKTEFRLREAINEKEFAEIYKFNVVFYWLWGLAGVVAGVSLFRLVYKLLGLPFMIGGFTVMIYYTSDITSNISSLETATSMHKLILSVITLLLLVASVYLAGDFNKEKDHMVQHETLPK
jgi:hypothetical protein